MKDIVNAIQNIEGTHAFSGNRSGMRSLQYSKGHKQKATQKREW